MRDTLIRQGVEAFDFCLHVLDRLGRIRGGEVLDDCRLEGFVLDLRLGRLARGRSLLGEKLDLVVDERNHFGIHRNSFTDGFEHFDLSHRVDLSAVERVDRFP